MKPGYTLLTSLLVFIALTSQAHHSFSIFDIDNKISRTGVLTKFEFSNPHIMLELKVTNEDGTTEIWVVESMNTGRWDRNGYARDMAVVGETVTIVGFPARNGKDFMALSELNTERGDNVIYEEVRQPGVEFIVPPPTTIKRQ